jgi:hypothetical protein
MFDKQTPLARHLTAAVKHPTVKITGAVPPDTPMRKSELLQTLQDVSAPFEELFTALTELPADPEGRRFHMQKFTEENEAKTHFKVDFGKDNEVIDGQFRFNRLFLEFQANTPDFAVLIQKTGGMSQVQRPAHFMSKNSSNESNAMPAYSQTENALHDVVSWASEAAPFMRGKIASKIKEKTQQAPNWPLQTSISKTQTTDQSSLRESSDRHSPPSDEPHWSNNPAYM